MANSYQSIKCLDTTSGPRRFTFKSISQRIEEIDINVYKSLDPVHPEPKSSSFFLDRLLYWRELNTAEDFISFYDEMMPLVQTLPQILFHKERVFSELLCRVNMKAHLSLEPILMLVASLCRDILQEFLPFLQRFTSCLVDLLKDGGHHHPDILEQVFTSWQYIMMYLQKYLVKDVVNVLKITAPLRFFENDYVQDFMAEAVSFLLRNSSMTELRKGMRNAMLEVVDCPSSVKKIGIAALLFHVLRGTSSRLHSRAEKVFRWLIDKSFLSNSVESPQGLEAVLEVATDVIKRLWKEVDHKEFSMIYKCLLEEINSCINGGCMMHLNSLLSLLITTVCQCNGSQVYDSNTLLELVRLLIQSYIVPSENMMSEDHVSEVLIGILELMLCLLDNPTISSDLSTISQDYAPAFKLKNSGILIIKRMLLKDPHIVHGFRCQIISAMDNLIEESPEQILFSMLKFFDGQEKLQPFNGPVGASSELLKIRKFFKDTLCSWIKLLNDITVNNSQSSTSISESDLAVLWGVLKCYPHLQYLQDNDSSVINLIASLDQLLEIEAGTILGFPKSTWQSLLGAALYAYHKLQLASKTGLTEVSRFLQLAKRHKSSSQVLFAVAEFLDSLFGDTLTTEADVFQNKPRDLDIDEAVVAFDIFADNLGVPNKEIRMSTLRILSHYAPVDRLLPVSDEPPHKKLKTGESGSSGSCNECAESVNVICLLLSVESTPVSISTSRKIVNLISRLQKGVSSASFNHRYMPLVLNGIIGILHNRLSYLWQPGSECLAVLLRRYKDLVWNKFVQFLEDYQLNFLSSSSQSLKINSESPQENTLVDCFSFFLAPDFDSTPRVTVISQLLKSLQEVHDLAESRSRQLMPLFFKFLGYPDDNFLRAEAFSCHSCSRKE